MFQVKITKNILGIMNIAQSFINYIKKNISKILITTKVNALISSFCSLCILCKYLVRYEGISIKYQVIPSYYLPVL